MEKDIVQNARSAVAAFPIRRLHRGYVLLLPSHCPHCLALPPPPLSTPPITVLLLLCAAIAFSAPPLDPHQLPSPPHSLLSFTAAAVSRPPTPPDERYDSN